MPEEEIKFHRMGHIALKVRDLKKSEDFYVKVMGMKPVWRTEGEIAFLECGGDDLALIQIPKDKLPDYSGAEKGLLDHFGFRVKSREGVDKAAEEIKGKGVKIFGPVDHRDGSRSFYFPDPDGNQIQILYDPSRD